MSGVTFESTDGEVLGLQDVMESWRDGLPLELRPITRDVLAGLPPPVNDAVAMQVVEIATRYPSFDPPLAPGVREDVLIDVLASTRGDRLGLEIALALEELGQDAVASVIERLGVSGEACIGFDRVEILIDYLLDDVGSRSTVARAMARWPADDVAAARKARIAPYLDEGERALAMVDRD